MICDIREMRLLFLLIIGLLPGIPSGVLQDMLPVAACNEEMPLPEPTEDVSDALELLKLGDLLFCFDSSTNVMTALAEGFAEQTSPCTVVTPIDRESHFCRPPPSVVA